MLVARLQHQLQPYLAGGAIHKIGGEIKLQGIRIDDGYHLLYKAECGS
jgi:hypothetical protein